MAVRVGEGEIVGVALRVLVGLGLGVREGVGVGVLEGVTVGVGVPQLWFKAREWMVALAQLSVDLIQTVKGPEAGKFTSLPGTMNE